MSKKQSTKTSKTSKTFSSRSKSSVPKKTGVNKISASERKKSKILTARFNKDADVAELKIIQELNDNKIAEEPKKRQTALDMNCLVKDQKRDKKVREHIEKINSETNSDMLKQLELMSGFSL